MSLCFKFLKFNTSSKMYRVEPLLKNGQLLS